MQKVKNPYMVRSEKPLHGAKSVLNDWFTFCLTGRKQITEFGP